MVVPATAESNVVVRPLPSLNGSFLIKERTSSKKDVLLARDERVSFIDCRDDFNVDVSSYLKTTTVQYSYGIDVLYI